MTHAAGDPPLPPGQQVVAGMRVQHYGPVPRFRPDSWNLTINGATADGAERQIGMAEFADLPFSETVADFHCVTKWSVRGRRWGGVPSSVILALVPPAPEVTHVMAWAEYGYSTNLRLADFAAEHTLLATHLEGSPLPPEHGYPLRLVVPHLYAWKGPKWLRAVEYLTEARRGFWEERGYHVQGDPWREERYSYLE